MHRILIAILFLFTMLFAFGEAGASSLLISPGAKSAGMGEAMVAYPGNPIMSYYNPAALIFTNSGISISKNNYSPNLYNDSHQTFLALNYTISTEHSIGANYQYITNVNFLNMRAISINYAYKLSEISSIGITVKNVHQKYLYPYLDQSDESKNILYDLSFFRNKNNLNIGLHLANMGKPISFSNNSQADPAPTNLSMGLFYTIYNNDYNKLSFSVQVDKLLVTRYQMMDWDGDGYVGGYDEFGSWIGEQVGEYNIDGKKEYDRKGYFDDPWYLAIFTAWLDDWYLGGDIDYDGDTKIGGWTWDETMDMNEDGEPDIDELVEDESGVYGKCIFNKVCLEKGTGDNRSFKKELEEMIFKYGIEYNFIEKTFFRIGYIHDFEGKNFSPTFGFGFAIENLMLDYGYTGGERGDPRENTHFFSLEYKLPPNN